MKNYLILSAALVAVAMPSASYAQEAKAAEKPAAAKSGVDTNGDGIVTKPEADAVSAKDFAVFDTNKDGNISKDEFKAFIYKSNAKMLPDDAAKKKAEPMINAQFGMLDMNKDGKVSKAEFMEDSTRRFKALDGNGDGKVSKEEVADVQKKMKAQYEKMKAAAEKKAAEKK